MADLFSQLIAFLQVIIIVRFLGASNYGLLTLVVVYAAIINQLIDFRIQEAVVKYLSEFLTKNDRKRAWASLKLFYLIDFFTGVIAFLLVFLTAGLIAVFIIHDARAVSLVQLFAFMLLVLTLNGTCCGVLTVFEKFTALSIYTIAVAILRFIFVTIILLLGYGIKGVLVGYIVAGIFSSAFILVFCIKIIKKSVWFPGISGKLSLLKHRSREIAMFLINTNLNESLTLITKNIDILILGYCRAPSEVGFYRLAKNFVEILSLFSSSVYTAIYPKFSKLWADNKISEFKDLIKRTTIFMGILALPITVVMFLGAPWIINIFMGTGFLPAVFAIRVMLWGFIVAVVFLWVRPVFLSMGKPGTLTIINTFNAVIMVILSLIFVPKFGYFASAVIYTYPYIAGHLLAIFVFLRILKHPKYASA
jgi:O-antigen/teichoic acid export membrane protein